MHVHPVLSLGERSCYTPCWTNLELCSSNSICHVCCYSFLNTSLYTLKEGCNFWHHFVNFWFLLLSLSVCIGTSFVQGVFTHELTTDRHAVGWTLTDVVFSRAEHWISEQTVCGVASNMQPKALYCTWQCPAISLGSQQSLVWSQSMVVSQPLDFGNAIWL